MMSTSETQEIEVVSSKHSRKNDESDSIDNDVYFLILRSSEEKIDFTGLNYETENKIRPLIAFKNRVKKEDKTYLEEIVFKFKKKRKKKEKDKGKKESNKSIDYSITF